MVAFTFQGLLDSGPASYLTGISDLDIHMRDGVPVLYAASGPSGGITCYRLIGGAPTFLDREGFGPGQSPATPGQLEEIEVDAGQVLVSLGRHGAGLQCFDVAAAGQLVGTGQLTAPGGLPAAAVSMACLKMDGTTYAYVSHLGLEGLTTYRIGAGGQMTWIGQQGGTGGGAQGADLVAIAHVEVGGQDYLLSLSALTNSLTSYRIGTDGLPEAVGALDASIGLALTTPTALATAQVEGVHYAVVAASGSNSLSVLQMDAEGMLVPTDHVLDDLNTRFHRVTALEAVSIGERVFLVAGGGDDGLSLFTLLPGGRLLHLDQIADDMDMALNNISALALHVQDGIIHVFASGQAELGITHLTVDPGPIGETFQSGATGGVVSGTSGGDVMIGGTGNDTLQAQGGDDILIDGAGSDKLRGGDGADVFVFVADGVRDTVEDFELGKDRLDLSGFGRIYSLSQMTITPTSWGATVVVADEEVRLYSMNGLPIDPAAFKIGDLVDLAHYPTALQAGDSTVPGGSGNDALVGDTGNDTLSGYAGNDTLQGRGGDDSLSGGADDDWLEGGNGHDVLDGGNDNDTLLGGEGTDTLLGQGGNDSLMGGAGNDVLNGDAGNDTLRGGSGDDRLTGGAQEDRLYGDAGNDTLLGHAGFDWLEGGAGDDVLDGGDQADNLQGGDGNDILLGDAGNDVMRGDAGDDTLLGQGGNDSLQGNAGRDVLNGDAGNDTLSGGSENDILRGGTQEDRLYGGAGNDTLLGHAGFDWLEGGAGNDVLDGGDQADNLLGGTGNDTMWGGSGFDRLFGQEGDDRLYGGDTGDSLYGQEGDDRLHGQAGNDGFWGGIGNDFLDGGADNDRLIGGAGFDTLLGSTGNDMLIGAFNADTFVFADFGGGFGQDTIADFDANNPFEKIDLSRVASIGSFADLDANHLSQAGAHVVIDALGGNTIRLLNVDIDDLDASDFIF